MPVSCVHRGLVVGFGRGWAWSTLDDLDHRDRGYEHARDDRQQRGVAAWPARAGALGAPEHPERAEHHPNRKLQRVLGHFASGARAAAPTTMTRSIGESAAATAARGRGAGWRRR